MRRARLVLCLVSMLSPDLACKRDRASEAPEPYDSYPDQSPPEITVDEVCERLTELLEGSFPGVGPEQEALIEACPSTLFAGKSWRYGDDWEPFASCMLNAVSESEFQQCSVAYPNVGPHEDMACYVVVNIVAAEAWNEAGGTTPVVSDEKRDELKALCLDGLEQNRMDMPRDAYEAQVLCMEDAMYPADARACFESP